MTTTDEKVIQATRSACLTCGQDRDNDAHREGTNFAFPHPYRKGIKAFDLQDDMVIEHRGSGQHFEIRDVSRKTPGTVTWNGILVGDKAGYLHSFNAPDDWPLVLIKDAPTVLEILAEIETVDITPESLKTAEGAAKVQKAMEEWSHSQATVACSAAQFMDAWGYLIFDQYKGADDVREDLQELRQQIAEMQLKQNAFLRAVAGR